MQDEEFLTAIGNSADLSFDPEREYHYAAPINPMNGRQITCPVLIAAIVKDRIAKRPSKIKAEGFIPGERPANREPFDAAPAKPFETIRIFRRQHRHQPPSGRTPTADERNGAWQLQEEYKAGRLGEDTEENSRNWNIALWIDKNYRAATMPADAARTLDVDGLGTSDWRKTANADEISEAFGVEKLEIHGLDKKWQLLNVQDATLVRLINALDKDDVSNATHMSKRIELLIL
jgi:hypothetical protein